jgi:dihydroxyacid dehydratase/phosphogluconate dehydratase
MPISLVKDGDAIEIDIKGKIDLDISRPEIRKRQIFKVLIKHP